MSARSTMRHRCTIQRDQAGEDTGYGGQEDPDWQDHLTDQACHFWFRAGRQITDGSKTAVVEDQRLLVPLGTDVKATDRILTVTDRLGSTIIQGPLLIDTVGRRQDHLVLFLKQVMS